MQSNSHILLGGESRKDIINEIMEYIPEIIIRRRNEWIHNQQTTDQLLHDIHRKYMKKMKKVKKMKESKA